MKSYLFSRRRFLEATVSAGPAANLLFSRDKSATERAGPPRLEASAAQADFYVSPVGNDGNPGSLEKPFHSLARARDAVSQLRKTRRVRSPVVVMLRGGTYRLSQSVVFSGRDSGTERARITYMAYPGESPILSGGRPVTRWQVYKDRILCAVLPKE